MKKPTPCDECRNQRRLCTRDNPCKRCLKFNITCSYTNTFTPFDEEYIQKVQLLEQVEQLRTQLHSMEYEMATLQLAAPITTTAPVLSTIPFDNRLIKQSPELSGTDTKNNSWSMTLCKGKLVIRTNIKTHTELIAYLLKTRAILELNHSIPCFIGEFGSSSSSEPSNVLQMIMWKRYRLSRYKRITQDPSRTTTTTNNLTFTMTTKDIAMIQNDIMSMMTWNLLQAYLYCRHLQHLTIHVPTFLNRLVRPDVMQSPAVLALCAIACATPCHHMSHLLPQAHTSAYGRFFFNQARALVMDTFDDISLEIYATYVLMAFYQLLIHKIKFSRHYSDLAERVGMLLIEKDPTIADQVLFRRLKLQLIKTSSPGHMTKYRHLDIATANPDPPFLNDYHIKADLLKPTDDDSDREKQHLLLSIYITHLHEVCHQVVHHGPSQTTEDYLSTLGHMIEMALRQWYMNLPMTYRMDTMILGAFGGQDSGSWLPALTRITDAIPLLTTMTLCSEYMMMAKTHVCENPEDLRARQDVARHWRTTRGRMDPNEVRMRWGERWLDQVTKLTRFMDGLPRSEHGVEAMAKVLESGYTGFDHLIARTAVMVAIRTVELLQYLAEHYPCQYDQRVTLNAWDVLLRAARFGFGEREVVQVNLLCCLAMVRADLKLSLASAAVVDQMELDYEQCLDSWVC